MRLVFCNVIKPLVALRLASAATVRSPELLTISTFPAVARTSFTVTEPDAPVLIDTDLPVAFSKFQLPTNPLVIDTAPPVETLRFAVLTNKLERADVPEDVMVKSSNALMVRFFAVNAPLPPSA